MNHCLSRKQIAIFLGHVQKQFCAYIGDRCDCKYGAIDNPEKIGKGSEHGNGCPETSSAKAIFDNMTDKEFERIIERIKRRDSKYVKKMEQEYRRSKNKDPYAMPTMHAM